MTILIDPEGNETSALFDLYPDWAGKSVLEIGSGDGRLTWLFAGETFRVVALEPDPERHADALKTCSPGMAHVEFLNMNLDEFTGKNKEKFDIALLSWSL